MTTSLIALYPRTLIHSLAILVGITQYIFNKFPPFNLVHSILFVQLLDLTVFFKSCFQVFFLIIIIC